MEASGESEKKTAFEIFKARGRSGEGGGEVELKGKLGRGERGRREGDEGLKMVIPRNKKGNEVGLEEETVEPDLRNKELRRELVANEGAGAMIANGVLEAET